MALTQDLPHVRDALLDAGGSASRAYYLFFERVDANIKQALSDIVALQDESGGGGISGNVTGSMSIQASGALPGVVVLYLAGDADAPGNTTYYGTNSTGVKGYYPVGSALLGTPGDITLTIGADGVTTIDLADVTNTGVGALFAIARDAKGRITGTRAATITGTANRVTVTNGDAIAGLPTIDIAPTYAGQTSIATLGTVTTGTWQATAIDAAHGGTGQTTYAVGDLLYASGATTLARLADVATGNVLRSGGIGVAPAWGKVALTTDVSGLLPVANGGTGVATAAANLVFAGPASGAAAAPTFRAPLIADIATAFPQDYKSGLRMAWQSGTSITFVTGEAWIPSLNALLVLPANLTKSGLVLAANTMYHAYLFNNAGTADVDISTTAPVGYFGEACIKTGDNSRRYIGSFITDGAGAMYRFQQNGDEINFIVNNSPPFRVLNGGTAIVRTNVDLTPLLPITAKYAICNLINNDASNQLFVDIPEIGNSGALSRYTCLGNQRTMIITACPSRTLQYLYSVAPTGAAFIDVYGYKFSS